MNNTKTVLGVGLSVVVLASACGSPDPNVVVRMTPDRGAAPLMVTFDVTGSDDPEHPGAALTARFDFDGNGTWDTEPSAELTATFLYEQAGTYRPKIEVQSVENRVGLAELSLDVVPNQPPVAAVTAGPPSGRAPHAVTVDASASSDPDEDVATLEVRFDFDSDGTWDTEYGTEKTAAHVFQRGGQYRVTVEVRDRAGATATAQSKDPIDVQFGADLDADTNRDGVVDDLDDDNEEAWTTEHGAVFIANMDDDDFDQRRDAEVLGLDGAEDLADFATLLVRRIASLGPQDTATIRVTPDAAAQGVHIAVANGGVTSIHSPGASTERPLPIDALTAGDLTLLIEGVRTRSAAWDGRTTITLKVTTGGETLTDVVQMRVSPVIFTDNLQPAQRLYVMRIDDRRLGPNLEFYQPLDQMRPASVELYTADQWDYLGDRWLQDNMQTGYQAMPTPQGWQVMQTHLQTQRPTGPQGLEPFLTDELLGGNRGYEYPGRSRDTSLNYGGNLEIAPPYDGYPLGRLIAGGGEGGTLGGRPYGDTMSEGQIAWLEAQELQAPMIQVPSEWLAVGHIDEIFLFVPDKTATADARPYKVVIASPDLARSLLEDVSTQGGGALRVFQGRETQTTVDAILGDDTLMDYQDAAQAKIDTVREILMAEIGLTEADFVEVPVLYESHFFDGYDFAAAYNPGIQNLVVLDDTLFVPDPEGPVFQGTDVLRASADATLRGLGLNPIFVDIFDSYHLNLGEAHCGTEVEGAPYAEAWWAHDE